MKDIKGIEIDIMITVLVYAVGFFAVTFIAWDGDAERWTEFGRLCYLVFFGIVSAFFIMTRRDI
jgi:hypothetical protein